MQAMTISSMHDKYKFKRKPRKCPKCSSKRIATILFGMPEYSAKLEKDMKDGRIVLGGCCIEDGAPDWTCADCNTVFFKYE